MPRKISLEEKMKWLEDYENGKSEAKIAKDEDHHLRIIKNGIEEARRTRDIRIANVEIMKDVLRAHQKNLTKELQSVQRRIEIPPYDFIPLHWDDCINHSESTIEIINEQYDIGRFSTNKQKSKKASPKILDLVKQHLQYDETKLWPKLDQWETVYSEFLEHRVNLQLKIIDVMNINTGYPIIDEKDNKTKPPFIPAYIAGAYIYKLSLDYKLKNDEFDFDESEFVADSALGRVTYRNSIMAECPGNADQTKRNLLKVLEEIKISEELYKIPRSTEKLTDITEIINSKIEDILLINYIPGRCDICRRLGL